MKTRKVISILGLLLAFAIVLPEARADQFDQASKLTFNQPVQIPGRVLPAGTYWFVVADTSVANRNIIHIFNSDRSTLYATLLTNGSARSQGNDKTTITFAERGAAKPEAIVDWFYPGRTIGHQFVYPTRDEREEIASAKHQTVLAAARTKNSTEIAGD
jgi:hypothetical protein